MANVNRKVRINRPTYIDGAPVGKDQVLWVPERQARELLANGKAVPAGDQEKAENEPEGEQDRAALVAENKKLTAKVGQLDLSNQELAAKVEELQNENVALNKAAAGTKK